MNLHPSEWLDLAKQVPVGQKRRVVHGAECTKAMDVWNAPESWSAWCHRCHAGGRVYKQYIQKIDVTAPEYKRYLEHDKLIPLEECERSVLKVIVKLLHDKGMSITTVRDLKPMYNPSDKRLVFRFKGVFIGRDTTGLSPAKWSIYHHDRQLGYVYLQGSNAYQTREPVILTEDLFSAQKIRYYTGCSTLCLLGTNFKQDTAHFLLDKLVVVATDGDLAGDKARRTILKRCELFGIEATAVRIPNGLDPKDLTPQFLVQLFGEYKDGTDRNSNLTS